MYYTPIRPLARGVCSAKDTCHTRKYRGRTDHFSKTLSCCHLQLWLMTLTYESDLDTMNHQA